MNLTTQTLGSNIVVKLDEARLDHMIAHRFMEEVVGHSRNGPGALVIDLSQVQFMDSSGLGAVVGIRKRLGWGVRIVLAGLRSPVYRVFELARMTELFTFYTSTEAAAGLGAALGRTVQGRG